MFNKANPRIAIVHDWLVVRGGAERVLEEMIAIWPDADLFSVLDHYGDDDRVHLRGKRAATTFVQNLPQAAKRYRGYLPLMPFAIEQLNLSKYDIVVSSSHAVAKGIITGPDQLHVCYIHSPIRYAWDLQHQYLSESGLDTGIRGWLARWFLHRIRIWDVRTASGVDEFVANSSFIARRVAKVYGRNAIVIHPPVNTKIFTSESKKEDFFLTASRLVPYKKIAAIVEAFREMPEKKLVVIGDGPELKRIQNMAGPNVMVLGHQPFEVLRSYMQRARGFIFNAEEDFGIVPVEAQACGTPVIAFGRGGVLDSVLPSNDERKTGIFYDDQSPAQIVNAVKKFDSEYKSFSADACRRNAERFSSEKFREKLGGFVESRFRDLSSRRSAY
jgi:glycosyltransferase involved in cell wall biosynthesis